MLHFRKSPTSIIVLTLRVSLTRLPFVIQKTATSYGSALPYDMCLSPDELTVPESASNRLRRNPGRFRRDPLERASNANK